MCAVVPRILPRGRCPPPLDPPSRGASGALNPLSAIAASGRCTTSQGASALPDTPWPRRRACPLEPCLCPRGQPCADWMRASASPLDHDQALMPPWTRTSGAFAPLNHDRRMAPSPSARNLLTAAAPSDSQALSAGRVLGRAQRMAETGAGIDVLRLRRLGACSGFFCRFLLTQLIIPRTRRARKAFRQRPAKGTVAGPVGAIGEEKAQKEKRAAHDQRKPGGGHGQDLHQRVRAAHAACLRGTG